MLNMQDEGPPPPGPAPPVTLLTPPTKPTLLPDWFSADEAFLDLREIEHQNYLSPGSCMEHTSRIVSSRNKSIPAAWDRKPVTQL